MSLHDRIDPESRGPLKAVLRQVPGGLNTLPTLAERRTVALRLEAEQAAPVRSDVVIGAASVGGLEPGEPSVGIRTYLPAQDAAGRPGRLPAICYVHGGGMVMGSAAGEDATAAMLCAELGVAVVSVDYRLAPEHPSPAAVHDVCATLRWMSGEQELLPIDPARIAVYGGSAGGGLALASVLHTLLHGGPRIALVMAAYPMVDHRNVTPSSHEITDLGVWDRAANVEAWEWYLGGRDADEFDSPALARDLAGFPPTFLDVGTLDLFRDEDIELAQRLMQAGVPTELHVHPGSYHASEHIAPEAALSQRIWATRLSALRRALTPVETGRAAQAPAAPRGALPTGS